jgi:Tfp pilus assembly pilus retraction ATPase PilT
MASDDFWLTHEQRANKVFRTALVLGASSVGLESGQSAQVWLNGTPRRLDMAPLSRDKMELLLRSIMDDRQWKALETTGEVEFLHVPDVGGQGLRVKVHQDRDQIRVTAHPLQ